MIYRRISIVFLLLILFENILFSNGQKSSQIECDDQLVNNHMHQCYKQHIDPNFDLTSNENGYFLEGNLLCQAYNQSLSYRQCLSSIYNSNGKCSSEKYPFTYQYSKIYWKLIVSSCQQNKNIECIPSRLSHYIINKCHYSFDQTFPTKCKDFLRSIKCLEKYEDKLVLSTNEETCSKEKAYYYFYGDLIMRLQLSINICESF